MSRNPNVLLAKKPSDPLMPRWEETLAGHTCAVVESAVAIMESIGGALQTTFALSEGDMVFLEKCLLRAAVLHDLGKASGQFQKMLRGERSSKKQALRHEWISAWIPLWSDEMSSWLFQGNDTLRDAVLCAVLGHHLKAEDATSIAVRGGSGDICLSCYFGHPDFADCLREAGARAGLSEDVPIMEDVEIDLAERPLAELRRWFLEDLDWAEIIPIAKALLMAADLAGSALPAKRGLNIKDWIADTLGRRCTETDIGDIVAKRLQGNKPLRFQNRVKDSTHRVTLVCGGCGSGKTVAAYIWAAERAAGRKLFFCYPTTGTATEGYRDYVIPSEMRVKSVLLHSRSEVDIERIFEAERDIEVWDSGLGISALASWDVPLTLCTVDKVLGIIQNSRSSLYSSPAFMNAAFVFDEIHMYDSRLWGALLRFLKAFRGAPVLLMTASLPKPRFHALKKLLHRLAVIEGPKDLEAIKRYKLHWSGSEEIPWRRLETALERGGKVLWVCNTVSGCVERGKEAERRFGEDIVLSYHSRFRYKDRRKHHNNLIEAFRGRGPVLAITTQVCEVSLDISADLLVTDLAPIPALIQRLGRLNRRAEPQKPPLPRDAIFIEPPTSRPYDKDDLEDALEWLRRLENRSVSQLDLAREFETIAAERRESYKLDSSWLDGGKFTGQSPLREMGYTIPVLRGEDVEAIKGKIPRRFVILYEIPMLLDEVAGEIHGWRRLRHAWVAPPGRINYDEKWGAEWTKRRRTRKDV